MSTYLLIAVVVLAIAKIVHAAQKERRTRGTAETRAGALAEHVLARYRALEGSEPQLDPTERRILALLASGRTEADIRALVERAPTDLHKTLQMLTVSLAVQAERAATEDSATLMTNIVSAQKAVMSTIPKGL